MQSSFPRCFTRSKGVAYILLLVSIAVIGIVASSTVNLNAQMARRDAEQDLFFIGEEFEAALRSYASLPVTAPNYLGAHGPRTLEELLKDPRSASVKRHLRKIYADPMTGRNDWGLVKDQQGFILGIYSLDETKPFKRTGFRASHQRFEDADSYAAWVFGLPGAIVNNNVAGLGLPP